MLGNKTSKTVLSGDIKSCCYKSLYYVDDDKLYLELLKKSQEIALSGIKEKIKSKEQIKLAFQVSFISIWPGDELLQLFLDDNRFDVTVVAVWQENSVKEVEIPQIIDHFRGIGVNYVFADGRIKPGDFDIVFYTSPYLEALHNWKEKDVPLSTLICYTPYGFLIADIQQMYFNHPIHSYVWKNYTFVEDYLGMAKNYCKIGDYGMVVSGYSKMDLSYRIKGDLKVKWKTYTEDSIKIIYAPHHSIDAEPFFSTFKDNYMFFLDYARNHSETTSWVFKPHPLLRVSAVETGTFKNEKEYDEYLNSWNELPNAMVIEDEYMEFMYTSDAMILDSVSFMAEYLYYHKPILFLTRDGERFNEFGEMLKKAIYTCKGNSVSEIAEFIEKTIVEDPDKRNREGFFADNLDYVKKNGMLASDYIYNDVVNELFK